MQSDCCVQGVTHTEPLSMTTGMQSFDAQSGFIMQAEPSGRPGFGMPPIPPVLPVVPPSAPPAPPVPEVDEEELVVLLDDVLLDDAPPEDEVVAVALPPVWPPDCVAFEPPAAQPRPHPHARAHAAIAVPPSQETMRIRGA